jgi:chemotaxis protein MotB
MGTQNAAAPVIIKRKKVVAGGGHHGGAWKVAYADFVTAMMAFFMLMWLLNATTEKQRKGLADYFSPTIAVNRISGGGDGSFGGDSVFSEQVMPQNGTGATSLRPTESRNARGETGLAEQAQQADGAEDESLKQVAEMLMGHGAESVLDDALRKHVIMRLTDEGLVIEFFDLDGSALFVPDTADPTPVLESLTQMLVDAVRIVTNAIAVEAHVTSQPIVLAQKTVWDMSSARAQAMRALLEEQGLDPGRLARVTGHADRQHKAPNPMSPRNNRLEIILLRQPR